jgi:hypothetical protein
MTSDSTQAGIVELQAVLMEIQEMLRRMTIVKDSLREETGWQDDLPLLAKLKWLEQEIDENYELLKPKIAQMKEQNAAAVMKVLRKTRKNRSAKSFAKCVAQYTAALRGRTPDRSLDCLEE